MESFGLFHDKCNMSENERKLDGHAFFFPKKASGLDNISLKNVVKFPQETELFKAEI